MNTTVATLSADLVIHQEQFNRALSQVHGQLSTLNNTLRAITGAVVGLFAFDKVRTGMESVVGAAIDLEARLSQVRKTTGLAGSELGALRTQLEGLASTVGGLKFDELLNLAAIGGRLGIAGDKLGNFARDMGLIRVALQDIPAEEAATSIGRILNVFQLGSEDAIKFASALSKLDNSSSATGRDILEITQRISGSASVLGLSAQKVLALSTALKDAGVENQVAGTAISQLFSKMATDTQKFADVSGMSLGRFASVLQADPLSALMLFEKGLARLDGVSQLQLLDTMELDGARVKATLSQLNSVVDRLPGYVRIANGEWKTLDSILKQVEVAGNTTRAQLDRMHNVLQITAATIGEFMLPVVKALANSFDDLAGDVQRFFRGNETAMAGFADKVRVSAGYVGLFFREFKTLSQVGLLLGVEKFEQFVEVMRRVGVMAGANLTAGFTNAVVVIGNAFRALGPFLGDLFKQVGANLGANLTNALNDAIGTWSGNVVSRKIAELIDKFKPGTLKAFDDIARAGVRQVPVPAIAPDTSGLNQANFFRGVAPLPGFQGPFANLPNRGAEINPLLGQLDQARAAMNRDLDARRDAAMPKPKPVTPNPFLGKAAAALKRDRESAAKRERAALKDAQDAQNRAVRVARGGPSVSRQRERAATFTRSPLGKASAAAGAALGGPGLGGLDVSALFFGSQQGAAAVAQARAARARAELNQIGEAEAALPARRRRGGVLPVPTNDRMKGQPQASNGQAVPTPVIDAAQKGLANTDKSVQVMAQIASAQAQLSGRLDQVMAQIPAGLRSRPGGPRARG